MFIIKEGEKRQEMREERRGKKREEKGGEGDTLNCVRVQGRYSICTLIQNISS